jgi:uncharacterized protein with HEPN domain
MSRDASLYLVDIELACRKVLKYTKGVAFEQFTQDDEKYDAVLRNLEIIGEAVKHIPDKTRKAYPQVRWRKIAGFRDIAAHEYFGISDELIWDIVENEIPDLVENVKTILKDF